MLVQHFPLRVERHSVVELLPIAFLALAVLWLAGCDRSHAVKGQNPSSSEGNLATINAAPNPVPAGGGEGTTVLSWNTGDGSVGEVYVSVNGGEERLFTRGVNTNIEASWINTGPVYEFRLYRATAKSNLLASVKVTRNKK